MVTMLRPSPALRSLNCEAIASRRRCSESSTLSQWRSNGAFERLEAQSAAGIVGGGGRDGFNLRLGSLRTLEIKGSRRNKKQGRGLCVAAGGESEGESQKSRLGSIIKNKQRILEAQLRSMAEGELESRLALTKAVTKPYSLLDTIAQQIMEGRTAIVAEVSRLSPAETPEMLAERCANYVEWGKTCFVSRVRVCVHVPIIIFACDTISSAI